MTPGTAAPAGLGCDLPKNAEAEDDDGITASQLRVVHAVERHGADMREDADARVGTFGQEPRQSLALSHHMLRAVTPGAEHMLAKAQIADAAADFDDLADLLVAEIADRIGPARRRRRQEQTTGLLPLLGHVGVAGAGIATIRFQH